MNRRDKPSWNVKYRRGKRTEERRGKEIKQASAWPLNTARIEEQMRATGEERRRRERQRERERDNGVLLVWGDFRPECARKKRCAPARISVKTQKTTTKRRETSETQKARIKRQRSLLREGIKADTRQKEARVRERGRGNETGREVVKRQRCALIRRAKGRKGRHQTKRRERERERS